MYIFDDLHESVSEHMDWTSGSGRVRQKAEDCLQAPQRLIGPTYSTFCKAERNIFCQSFTKISVTINVV